MLAYAGDAGVCWRRYMVTHDLMGTVELYERALVNDPKHMLTLCNYAMLFHELLRTERRNKMMEFAHKIGAVDADTREGLLKAPCLLPLYSLNRPLIAP